MQNLFLNVEIDSTDAVVNKTLIDEMIVRLDEKISHQVDEILHNDKFQEMESAWRGLKLLVDRTDFRENIKIEVLNVSKEELLTILNMPLISLKVVYINMFIQQTMVNLVVSQLLRLLVTTRLRHQHQILNYCNIFHLLAQCLMLHLFSAAGPEFFWSR